MEKREKRRKGRKREEKERRKERSGREVEVEIASLRLSWYRMDMKMSLCQRELMSAAVDARK